MSDQKMTTPWALVLLEAELLRCKAKCAAVTAELQRIVVNADAEKLAELETAIRTQLKQLKEAADRLHHATIALKNGIPSHIQ
jgi:hypothetical protein